VLRIDAARAGIFSHSVHAIAESSQQQEHEQQNRGCQSQDKAMDFAVGPGGAHHMLQINRTNNEATAMDMARVKDHGTTGRHHRIWHNKNVKSQQHLQLDHDVTMGYHSRSTGPAKKVNIRHCKNRASLGRLGPFCS
jgi:uncharacterized protein (DUF4415 family)